jgi:3-mercaptopyruvate sulfurtransferase SseA
MGTTIEQIFDESKRERVRVYDGSWAEWGRALGTPFEQPELRP